MKIVLKKVVHAAMVLFLAVGVTTVFARESKSYGDKAIERATEYVEDIMEAPDTAIPQTLIEKCHGIVILRQYKAGFVIGAKGGSGVALVKDKKTGQWSPPALIASAEASFGFQIGGQKVDALFLIMNKEGMDMLLKTKFQIGVDASAAAGPVGRDASAKVGPGTAILVYSRAKGLYAGATFEGGVLVADKKENSKFYGIKNLTMKDILFEHKVKMPSQALPLVHLLKKYEK